MLRWLATLGIEPARAVDASPSSPGRAERRIHSKENSNAHSQEFDCNGRVGRAWLLGASLVPAGRVRPGRQQFHLQRRQQRQQPRQPRGRGRRSEEHTSELQSLMRISYAVFCWKKKNTTNKRTG